MKMTVFWDVAPCSLILTVVSEELPASIIGIMKLLPSIHHPDDGSSKLL
jgi:hypothetical protein